MAWTTRKEHERATQHPRAKPCYCRAGGEMAILVSLATCARCLVMPAVARRLPCVPQHSKAHPSCAAHAQLCVIPIPEVSRPVKGWVGILAIATLLKNISKATSKSKMQRKLADSGECPFPFVFFHDPIGGIRKHPKKLLGSILVWAFLQRTYLLRLLSGASSM